MTVTTLGNFISTLAYGKTDVEIPNDVLRILSQLNIAERRRSLSKTSFSEHGSDSDSLNRDPCITLGQARSLPPKSGSSYFAKSFDQIRQQQKLGMFSNDVSPVVVNKHTVLPIEKQLTKSLSDTHNITKFDRIIEESVSTDRSQSLGRAVNTHEMETLKQFQKNYRVQELPSPETPKRPPPLKASKSNFELITPMSTIQTSNDENSQYPLNCGGVQISYRGTRALKSLRPTRTRTDLQIDVPKGLITGELNNNVMVLVNGDADSDHSKDENCNKSVDSAFDESVESIESGNKSISEKEESPTNSIRETTVS